MGAGGRACNCRQLHVQLEALQSIDYALGCVLVGLCGPLCLVQGHPASQWLCLEVQYRQKLCKTGCGRVRCVTCWGGLQTTQKQPDMGGSWPFYASPRLFGGPSPLRTARIMVLCGCCVLPAARSSPGSARRLGACLPCRYFMKFPKLIGSNATTKTPATWRVCGCVSRCSTDKNCAKPRSRLVVVVSGV